MTDAAQTGALIERARTLLGQNQYLTLATADAAGTPWSSTVWFAAVFPTTATGFAVDFVWLSRPDAQHSRNLRGRPQVGISIFDSTQPVSTGDGLQFAAHAGPVPADRVDELMAAFSRRSVAAGGHVWSREHIEEPAQLRPYVARTDRAFLLEGGDRGELPSG